MVTHDLGRPRRRVGGHFVVVVVVVLVAFALSACRDAEEGSSASAVTGVASTGSSGGVSTGGSGAVLPNKPPTISGTPPDTVRAGTAYTFIPTAVDPDGDALSFSATGLPSWASLDKSSGRISGTPSTDDMGAHLNIRLSVSDGKSSTSLAPYGIYVVATALGAATLSWLPPTERADGTPLMDLAGYKVYWSMTPDEFLNSATISNPGLTSYMIEQLTPTTWYFTTTAFDSAGFESRYSNIASKTIGM